MVGAEKQLVLSDQLFIPSVNSLTKSGSILACFLTHVVLSRHGLKWVGITGQFRKVKKMMDGYLDGSFHNSISFHQLGETVQTR